MERVGKFLVGASDGHQWSRKEWMTKDLEWSDCWHLEVAGDTDVIGTRD